MDWRRVKEVEVGANASEGLISFFDGIERLFRLYRPGGPYPAEVTRLAGLTLWPSVAGEP